MFVMLKRLCKRLETNKTAGFTLIEIIIYTAIFAVSAGFLMGVLMTALKIQTRQSSLNALNQQISFVNNTIQRLVNESNSISMNAMPIGTATSGLTLNMADSFLNPTVIFGSGTQAIYLKQGNNAPLALTNSDTLVDFFTATRYQQSAQPWEANPPSLVQINFSLTMNSSNSNIRATRIFRTAIISCAKENAEHQSCW